MVVNIQVHPSQKTFNWSTLPIEHCPSPFSPPWVVGYLQAVGFRPIPSWTANNRWQGFELSLETLKKLMRLHVIDFPYENQKMPRTISENDVPMLGDLGQSTAKAGIVWKEEDMFKGIVTERKGYGAVCFDHGLVFRWILRALKYR